MTLSLGTLIEDSDGNQYRVEDLLGRGGFGAVYLVREKGEQGTLFAMKEIVDPERRERKQFLFEGDILKRLRHKALPHVYHVFEDKQLKRAYMLMDYIEGKDLDILLDEQPQRRFSYERVIDIIRPVVEGIIYLHSQQPPIVHRDIKPANIIVPANGGAAILVDFGIAKEDVDDNTTNVIRHGSPGYAALEQYGTGTNIRTDIYALGATLYTLLTGETPPSAIDRASSYKVSDPLLPVQELTADVPTDAALALKKAMAITKNDRFPSVEAFWLAFQDKAASTESEPPAEPSIEQVEQTDAPKAAEEPLTRSVPLDEKPFLWEGNHRAAALSTSLLLLIVLVGGIALYQATQTHGAASGQIVVTTPPVTLKPQRTGTASKLPSPSLYPLLAQTYVGTISDIAVSKNETTMYLMNVQQQQDHIQGLFQGLGQAGTFTGTVSRSGEIKFVVPIYNGSSTIVFEGNIKIGGGLAGSYTVFNQNKQSTGQYGEWTVNTGDGG